MAKLAKFVLLIIILSCCSASTLKKKDARSSSARLGFSSSLINSTVIDAPGSIYSGLWAFSIAIIGTAVGCYWLGCEFEPTEDKRSLNSPWASKAALLQYVRKCYRQMSLLINCIETNCLSTMQLFLFTISPSLTLLPFVFYVTVTFFIFSHKTCLSISPYI